MPQFRHPSLWLSSQQLLLPSIRNHHVSAMWCNICLKHERRSLEESQMTWKWKGCQRDAARCVHFLFSPASHFRTWFVLVQNCVMMCFGKTCHDVLIGRPFSAWLLGCGKRGRANCVIKVNSIKVWHFSCER